MRWLLGILDNIEWFKNRINYFILFTLGLLTTYLVSHLNNAEERALERQTELLNSIHLDEASTQFRDLLTGMWKKREKDIEKLFEEIKRNTQSEADLERAVSQHYYKLISGDFFGATVPLPWDFTLCAIKYDGSLFWHPGIPKGIRIEEDNPLYVVLKEKTGMHFWPNDLASEQLNLLFKPHRLSNTRLTKLYFQDIPKLQIVIVFESHINLIDRLLPIQSNRSA